MRVFLSPSNQKHNVYSGVSTTEDVQCGKIAQACKKALERNGFTVGLNHYGSLLEKCQEGNNGGYNAYIAIHSNSFNGVVSGTRIFTYGNGVNETRLAKCVFNALDPITPGTSSNVQTAPEFYELRNTKMAAILCECDFHDVPNVARWIVAHTTEIGEKLAEGICDYFGVKYKGPSTTSNGKFYQVVTGSFKEKINAENRVKELKAKGFDSFIQIK